MVESQKEIPSIEYKDGQIIFPSKSENELALQQRLEKHLEYQQAKKQLNVENVTADAVEELLNDPKIKNLSNETPVDQDWITRFFQTVENIGDEDMQRLWGKVLAGEVKQPKTFSLRTLEFLKNLTKAEADLFCKIGNYAAFAGQKHFVAAFDS